MARREITHHGKYVGPSLKALRMIQATPSHPINLSLSQPEIDKLVDQSFDAQCHRVPWNFPKLTPANIRSSVRKAVAVRFQKLKQKAPRRPRGAELEAIANWLSSHTTHPSCHR